jgi:hypothetical protein
MNWRGGAGRNSQLMTWPVHWPPTGVRAWTQILAVAPNFLFGQARLAASVAVARPVASSPRDSGAGYALG